MPSLHLIEGCRAAVAQLVEQRIRNAKVASSIPASGTKKSYKKQKFNKAAHKRLYSFRPSLLPSCSRIIQ